MISGRLSHLAVYWPPLTFICLPHHPLDASHSPPSHSPRHFLALHHSRSLACSAPLNQPPITCFHLASRSPSQRCSPCPLLCYPLAYMASSLSRARDTPLENERINHSCHIVGNATHGVTSLGIVTNTAGATGMSLLTMLLTGDLTLERKMSTLSLVFIDKKGPLTNNDIENRRAYGSLALIVKLTLTVSPISPSS